jgi:hypothetical protein
MTPLEREIPGATRGGSHTCRLGEAVNRAFVCEEACAFWETGGAVAPAGCLLDRVPVDLVGEPEAARVLLEVKELLEQPGSEMSRQQAHARLAALVRTRSR